MTAQWHDTFIYDSVNWDLVGIKGEGFFDPVEVGLNPIGTCTACWKGFLCKYKINDKEFLLDQLDINHGVENEGELEIVNGHSINGIEPEPLSDDHDLFKSKYRNLNYKINFTGGVIIAKNFIEELYVHMGFHPAWKYKNVIELIFQNGYGVQARDVSVKMNEVRKKTLMKPLRPDTNAPQEEIRMWIDGVFKMNYDFD